MKSKEMKDITSKMGQEIYGIDPEEALKKGICIQCKEPAIPKCYSEAGVKEFSISGLCEKCFDEICGY